MNIWQNSDLENIGLLLQGSPSVNPFGYKIKNVVVFLTHTTANGVPLDDTDIGLVIDNAIFISFQNTSDSSNLLYNGEVTIPAGTPALSFPIAQGAPQTAQTFKCEVGATALIIYQYKQII